jgi:hypothetical protein
MKNARNQVMCLQTSPKLFLSVQANLLSMLLKGSTERHTPCPSLELCITKLTNVLLLANFGLPARKKAQSDDARSTERALTLGK